MSESEVNTVTFENNKTYTLDKYGFLDPPDQWDEDFVTGMAEMQGIYGELTQEHWDFIWYLRNKFIEEKTVSVVVLACAENNITLSDLRFLFPTGYHRGACRIAGINYDFMYQSNFWLTYETTTMPKEEHKTTEQNFLHNFNDWNERFAHNIIREWKLKQGLTDRHREIIAFLRKYYQITANIPTVNETCRKFDLDLAEFRELFPEGYRRGACRIAGLPFFP